MIKKELYEKTVNILVDAYFNDTLEHGNCAACAVGNMVANNMGYTFANKYDGLNWQEVDAYDESGKAINWYEVIYYKTAPDNIQLDQINSTGYNIEQLTEIEDAFETAGQGKSKDEYMFNGLLAVIDALDIIHQNTDSDVTASTKQRFVRI